MTRPRSRLALAAAIAAPLLGGCGFFQTVGFAPDEVDETTVRQAPTREEPPRVEVQHVLIAFAGTGVPSVTRTKEEAERLAQQVHGLASGGRDFGELVRLYSDERHGDGVLRIANFGFPPEPEERARGVYVRGLTRVAFSIEPGEVALVPWAQDDSPYGWHVLRRIR